MFSEGKERHRTYSKDLDAGDNDPFAYRPVCCPRGVHRAKKHEATTDGDSPTQKQCSAPNLIDVEEEKTVATTRPIPVHPEATKEAVAGLRPAWVKSRGAKKRTWLTQSHQ